MFGSWFFLINMENSLRNKLKIIASISLCVFSTISVFSGVLAWFTARRVQDPDSDSMKVVNPTGVFKQLTIHKWIKASSTSSNYVFNSTPDIILKNDGNNNALFYDNSGNQIADQSGVHLNNSAYDLLDRRHPLLVLIELNDSNENVSIRSQIKTYSEQEINDGYSCEFLGDKRVNHQIYDENNVLQGNSTSLNNNGKFPLSSIIQYKVLTGMNAATYTYAIPQSYDSMLVTTSIPYAVNKSEIPLYSGTWSRFIPIIVDYFDTAIDMIYGNYLGVQCMSDPTFVMHYCCDFTLTI